MNLQKPLAFGISFCLTALLSGFVHGSLIKGFGDSVCASGEQEAQAIILQKLQNLPHCQAPERPAQLGGWTCKKDRGADASCMQRWRCTTQYTCEAAHSSDSIPAATNQPTPVQPANTQTASDTAPPGNSGKDPCKSEYASKLPNCEAMSCHTTPMKTPFGEIGQKLTIQGKDGNTCVVLTESTGLPPQAKNTKQECRYNPETLKEQAQLAEKGLGAKKVSVKMSGSLEVESVELGPGVKDVSKSSNTPAPHPRPRTVTTTFDGQEIKTVDPFSTGECKFLD